MGLGLRPSCRFGQKSRGKFDAVQSAREGPKSGQKWPILRALPWRFVQLGPEKAVTSKTGFLALFLKFQSRDVVLLVDVRKKLVDAYIN